MEPSPVPFPFDQPPPPIMPVLPTPAVTSAAAPPPVVAPQAANHPPYADMICEAIGALKDRNGSSKRAIAKYIESAYKDLPPTHSALLTHHLKRLKNNGQLVMVKKSYKLASAARSEGTFPESTVANLNGGASPPGPKRGRGRPPKPKMDPTSNPPQPILASTDPITQQPQPISLNDGPKKSPGRPRKNGVTGRGRGRPPKSGLKKSPGRPRKPKTVRSVVGVKRGRGRPPKAVTQLAPPQPQQSIFPVPGQPVAVPYADAAVATSVVASNLAAATVVGSNLPRPRGRPKGSVRAAGAAAGVTGKRRGRPPKIGGVIAKPVMARKATGKPVGRPRKITGGADSKAVAANYADVKGKLEFFQSKVKQALEVLRPHYARENNIGVIDAFQELEGLAAMDINMPFTVAPPPVQPMPPMQQPIQPMQQMPVQLPVPNEG